MSLRNKELALQFAQFEKALKIHGQNFDFVNAQTETNKFNEPISTEPEITTVHGLFHTQRTQINIHVTTDESGKIKTKDNPMVLCKLAEGSKITIRHTLTIGVTQYRVKAITDIENMHLWADISLEAIEDGTEQF